MSGRGRWARALMARALTATSWPYAASDDVVQRRRPDLRDVPLVPYHDWANRGPATMRVWLPTL